jgi:hypothetical protein
VASSDSCVSVLVRFNMLLTACLLALILFYIADWWSCIVFDKEQVGWNQ